VGWNKARWSLGSAFRALGGSPKDPKFSWSDLETTLLTADFGLDLTEELIGAIRSEVERIGISESADVATMARDFLEDRLSGLNSTLNLTDKPAVILVVGVNGVGKTTTIGKLSNFISKAGRTVLVAAADTFRAAAVDQLSVWAARSSSEIVVPAKEGQDPASVAFEAVSQAIDRKFDVVIVDTAGRLQNKSDLMDELGKIRRVIGKVSPVSETLLVLDATTGQNGLVQARSFLEHAQVTGLILTKVDGSAKGGFVVRIQEETGLPVKLIGSGEGIEDLQGFSPSGFARSLLED